MPQQGWDVKVKKYSPRILLYSLKETFAAWLSVKDKQIALNDVAFSNVKTVKLTIGAPGIADCDFNFASAANTTEQVIDLGAIIPVMARVLDVKSHTEIPFVGINTLVAEAGNASSGNQFIASATILAKNAITAVAHAGGLNVAPNKAATHVYVAATPGQNWSLLTNGKVAYYVTYVEALGDIDVSTTTTTTTTPTPTPTPTPTA